MGDGRRAGAQGGRRPRPIIVAADIDAADDGAGNTELEQRRRERDLRAGVRRPVAERRIPTARDPAD